MKRFWMLKQMDSEKMCGIENTCLIDYDGGDDT